MHIRPDFALVSQGDDMFKLKCGDIPVFVGVFLILINPPFLREKFLIILNILLGVLNKDGMMISINPARWHIDPLSSYKGRRCNAKAEAGENLKKHYHSVDLIQRDAGNALFGIGAFYDMGYFCFTKTPNAYGERIESIYTDSRYLGVILKSQELCRNHRTIQSMINQGKKTQSPYCVYLNSKYGENCGFNYVSSKPTKFPVYFDSEIEALNFIKYCGSRAVRNLQYMLSQNQHAEMGYIPVPDDLSHEWSDDMIANWMRLDDAQAEYLGREVHNYDAKDYIKYMLEIGHDGNIQYNENQTSIFDETLESELDVDVPVQETVNDVVVGNEMTVVPQKCELVITFTNVNKPICVPRSRKRTHFVPVLAFIESSVPLTGRCPAVFTPQNITHCLPTHQFVKSRRTYFSYIHRCRSRGSPITHHKLAVNQ